jgi:hypothetical protein
MQRYSPPPPRQRSSSASGYSSSPSEEYVSDNDEHYSVGGGGYESPSYPLRVNRTVAITVEVSPRSSEADAARRIRTSCYSPRDNREEARDRERRAARAAAIEAMERQQQQQEQRPKKLSPDESRRTLPPPDPYPLNPPQPVVGWRYYQDFELYPPPEPPRSTVVGAGQKRSHGTYSGSGV